MGYKKWTDADLIKAVAESTTKSDVVRKLHLSVRSSGNYQTIDKYIKKLNLDISHFKSEVFGSIPKQKPLHEILIINSEHTNTSNLKDRLIRCSLLENKCYNCGINDWLNVKLSLHLDHINGERTDNRIDNLRLLCPNCHSITPTYCRGASKLSRMQSHTCIDCNVEITKKSIRCEKCSGICRRDKKQKIKWLPTLELQELVDKFGYAEVGRRLNVTDNAVRKRLKTRK
jgi:hypothetical protein